MTRLALLVALALGTIGCAEKPGLRVKEEATLIPGAEAGTVIRNAALLPVLNRTEEPEAPVVLGKALVNALERSAPFKLIRPDFVPGRIAPLYELGVVPRLVSDIDQSGRTSPEIARLVGQGLEADAVLVASVTFYQQFTDHLTQAGEIPTTVVGGEIHLIDAKTGQSLWSAAKVRRDRGGVLGYVALEGTAQALADDLVATLGQEEEPR